MALVGEGQDEEELSPTQHLLQDSRDPQYHLLGCLRLKGRLPLHDVSSRAYTALAVTNFARVLNSRSMRWGMENLEA